MSKVITVFAGSLKASGNSLKIWSEGNTPTDILGINVFASEEAGQLSRITDLPGTVGNAATPVGTVNKLAEVTAAAYADEILTEYEQKLIEEARSALALARIEAAANIDGVLTPQEIAEIAAAKTRADLARIVAVSHADEIVTAEELRAINDASAKANAAQAAANQYTQGWSDQGADKTANNIAAGFSGQGALANLNTVGGTRIDHNSLTTAHVGTNLLLAHSGNIGDLVVNEGHIQNLSVSTLKIDDGAVSVSAHKTLASSISTGIGTLEVIDDTVTFDDPGYIFAVGCINCGFPNSLANWSAAMYVNNTQIGYVWGGISMNTSVVISGGIAVGTGTFRVKVLFSVGANSMEFGYRTLTVSAIKK